MQNKSNWSRFHRKHQGFNKAPSNMLTEGNNIQVSGPCFKIFSKYSAELSARFHLIEYPSSVLESH